MDEGAAFYIGGSDWLTAAHVVSASWDTVVSYATRTLLSDRIAASAAGSGQPWVGGLTSGDQRSDAGLR